MYGYLRRAYRDMGVFHGWELAACEAVEPGAEPESDNEGGSREKRDGE